jgi:hypothetical protein
MRRRIDDYRIVAGHTPALLVFTPAEASVSRIQVAVRCDRCVDAFGRSDSFCGYFQTAELACYRPLLPGRRPVLNAVVSRRSVTGMPRKTRGGGI